MEAVHFLSLRFWISSFTIPSFAVSLEGNAKFVHNCKKNVRSYWNIIKLFSMIFHLKKLILKLADAVYQLTIYWPNKMHWWKKHLCFLDSTNCCIIVLFICKVSFEMSLLCQFGMTVPNQLIHIFIAYTFITFSVLFELALKNELCKKKTGRKEKLLQIDFY